MRAGPSNARARSIEDTGTWGGLLSPKARAARCRSRPRDEAPKRDDLVEDQEGKNFCRRAGAGPTVRPEAPRPLRAADIVDGPFVWTPKSTARSAIARPSSAMFGRSVPARGS